MSNYAPAALSYLVKDVSDFNINCWTQAQIRITVSPAGKVTYTLNMTNDKGEAHGRAVKLYLKIDDTVCYNDFFSYSSGGDARWSTFPTGNNSSVTNSFSLSDNNTAVVEVTLGVTCGSMIPDHETRATFSIYRYDVSEHPTVRVSSNGDNNIKIECICKSEIAKKPLTDFTVYYTTDGTDPSTKYGMGRYYSSKQDIEKILNGGNVTFLVTQYRKCRVRVYLECVYGSLAEVILTESTGEATVPYFVAPGVPGVPALVQPDITAGERFTVRKPWTFSWAAAAAANTDSPIVGYRIRLYKDGKKIAIKDSSGTVLSTAASSGDILYDCDTPATSIVIDPILHGFKAGNVVNLSINSYTRYGVGNKGSILIAPNEVFSTNYTVESAGAVHLKTGTGWSECPVLVYDGTDWQEAESIKIKTGTGWAEAE